VTDPGAYTKFLQARHLTTQWTPEGFKRSTELFREVLRPIRITLRPGGCLRRTFSMKQLLACDLETRAVDSPAKYVDKVLAIDQKLWPRHDGLR